MTEEREADILHETRNPASQPPCSGRVQPVEEDAADAARLVAVLQEKVLVAPGLEIWRSRRRRCASQARAWRRGSAIVSASSWVRRRSSTGVRSAPPPNHQRDVATMRVFM